MKLVEEYDKIEAGKIIKESMASIIDKIDEIRVLMDEIEGFKTSYPAAVDELDGYIADIKTALNSLMKRYEK